jgi:elongation factor 1-gamma
MPIKLYYNQNNNKGLRNVIAASLAGVELESVLINPPVWKTEEHLRRHPLGKVPVLEHETGYLFESHAILRHIARLNPESGLYGRSPIEAAYVDQWIDFVATEVEPAQGRYQYAAFGYHTLDAATAAKTLDELHLRLKVYENHFKSNNYLVGTSLTIADVATVCSLKNGFQFVISEALRKTLPNLVRYFEFVSTQPAFLNHLGRTRYCTVPFPIPHEAQPQQQQQAKPKVQQEKKEQPKKEQPKKEQPKKEEQPAADEDDEPPKKKEANPLDLLPPSTFNLDDWKRRFLAAKDNTAQKTEFEWFWQNFDDQGWSLWYHPILYS